MPAIKTAPSRRVFVFSELKSFDDEQGKFKGYLSVFGNADSYKDIVDQGAFSKTLQDKSLQKQNSEDPYLLPILWQHNPSDPIGGFIDIHQNEKGLFVEGQLDLDIEQGKRAYSGLKKGYIKGLSIGYDTIKEEWKDGYRHLKEIRLWEGSVVTFGANDQALVNGVKSLEEREEEEKAASGKTSWPLADKDTAWDGGAAEKQLKNWAGDDKSKLNSVYLWSNGDEHKMPFCRISDGSPQIVFKAVTSAAGAVNGARGGLKVPSSDIAGIKSRINSIYRRAAKQYKDPSIKPPWGKKSFEFLIKARDFNEVVADRANYMLQNQYYDILQCLSTSVLEAAYDDDENDKVGSIGTNVDQFKDAVLEWAKVVQSVLGVDDDEDDMDPSPSVSSSSDDESCYSPMMTTYAGFMHADYASRILKSFSTSISEDTKAGRTISSSNISKIKDVITSLNGALKELSSLVDSEPDKQDQDGKGMIPDGSKGSDDVPLFISVLADAFSTHESKSPSLPPEKPASTTSVHDEDALLKDLIRRIREETERIVA